MAIEKKDSKRVVIFNSRNFEEKAKRAKKEPVENQKACRDSKKRDYDVQ